MNDQNQNLPAPRTSTDVLAPGKSSVPVRLGIQLQTLDEAWRLAQNMAQSTLVPKGFVGKPHDVLVAIQLGLEVGLAPMQALQSIAVINGRPSLWGDGFLALIMASEVYEDHDEYYEVKGQRQDGLSADDLKLPTTAAVCTFKRRGKERPVTVKFTIAQATKAGLIGKEGTWQSYPDRMLRWRARSWAGRDTFPDVLRGLMAAEEAMDIPPDPPSRVITMQPPQRLSQAPPAPAARTSAEADLPRLPPNEGVSVAASAAEPATSSGVFIKDVIVTKGEGTASALIIDEHGTQYGSDDRGVIMSAQVAKEKGYRMEIASERRGDESVILEINRVPEATGK